MRKQSDILAAITPRRLKAFFPVFLCAWLFLAGLAYAGSDSPGPTKDSMLAAWEQSVKERDTTKVFETTDEPGVYRFETTLFPYKGRLKVNNVLIDQQLDYYYDYDLDATAEAKGIVELELMDAPENFEKKHPFSTQVWNKQNHMFFIADAGRWMTGDEWKKYKAAQPAPPDQNGSCGPAKPYGSLLGIVISSIPLLLLFVFLSVLAHKNRKLQKAQIEKYDLSMDRQLKSLEIEEQALAMQKEQLELLRHLAASGKD